MNKVSKKQRTAACGTSEKKYTGSDTPLSGNFWLITVLIVCGLLISLPSSAQKIRVKTGIEVLKESNFKILRGKRVGLITNPTGVDHNLKSTIDILHGVPDVRLVALYGPEHGVRGDVHAGDKIDSFTDPNTGVPVHSLYGATRKPACRISSSMCWKWQHNAIPFR